MQQTTLQTSYLSTESTTILWYEEKNKKRIKGLKAGMILSGIEKMLYEPKLKEKATLKFPRRKYIYA